MARVSLLGLDAAGLGRVTLESQPRRHARRRLRLLARLAASAADRSLTSPPSVADAASEDEAADLSPNVIGRGADIVSQGSAPAGSSRTARSPCTSDSLHDSAADRSLTSPPSVADAASEDEAADLSRKALGAGCDDEPEAMAQTAAVLAHVPQSPAAGERLGDSGARRGGERGELHR